MKKRIRSRKNDRKGTYHRLPEHILPQAWHLLAERLGSLIGSSIHEKEKTRREPTGTDGSLQRER